MSKTKKEHAIPNVLAMLPDLTIVNECRWDDSNAYAGDVTFLRQLSPAERGSAEFATDGPLTPIGELPAAVIEDAADETAELCPGWKLAGDDGDPVHDRVAAHFRPLLERQREIVEARKAAEDATAAERERFEQEIAAHRASEAADLWGQA